MNSKLSNDFDRGTAVAHNTYFNKKDIDICKRTLEFLEKKQAEYVDMYGDDEDDECDLDE